MRETSYQMEIEADFVSAIEYRLRNDYTPEELDSQMNWELFKEKFTDNGGFHEIVDSSVPIYNTDIVETWLACGMPEARDYGDDCYEQDIIRQMMYGLYYWADEYANENFESFYDSAIYRLTSVKA